MVVAKSEEHPETCIELLSTMMIKKLEKEEDSTAVHEDDLTYNTTAV